MIVNKQTRRRLYKQWAEEYLGGVHDFTASGICWRCEPFRATNPLMFGWFVGAIKLFPELYKLMQFSDYKYGCFEDGYWYIKNSGDPKENRELRATVLLFCYWIAKDADN